MNTYIGSKLVTAVPMSQATYCHFRSQPIPEDSWGHAEGFMVEDPKGKANTMSYTGQMSWMPRLQFESEYLDLGAIRHEAPYRQRLLAELAQLQEKLSGLLLFIKSDAFYKLSFKERELLLEQSRVMTRYVFILEDRIKG